MRPVKIPVFKRKEGERAQRPRVLLRRKRERQEVSGEQSYFWKKLPFRRGRIIVLRKKRLSAVLCVVAAAAIFGAVSHPAIVGAASVSRQLPIYCVQRDQKVVALSFDAAWGNEDTQQLIDILGGYQIKATFFVVGDWVDKYPESVKALHEAGHEIMNHSNTHAHMTKLTPQEITADVTACNEKIQAITGVCPTLIRPPYGEYDDKVINTIRSMGMEPVQWDVDSLDWKDLSAQEITERVTKKVAPGSIVLFHNAALNTPEALPGIIQTLLQDGYSFLPVSEILLTGEYSLDHTGRQCPA